MVRGLARDLRQLTIIQIDAHGDLIDELDGQKWCHGTVMRRLWEQGCSLIQVGVRSVSRSEYEFCREAERVETYFAHELEGRWVELLERIGRLEGEVYLSVDLDGLDPGVVPSVGTPQPNGLSWNQAVAVIKAATGSPSAPLIGADVVELVASPHPPGCDLIAARLAAKVIAFWAAARK